MKYHQVVFGVRLLVLKQFCYMPWSICYRCKYQRCGKIQICFGCENFTLCISCLMLPCLLPLLRASILFILFPFFFFNGTFDSDLVFQMELDFVFIIYNPLRKRKKHAPFVELSVCFWLRLLFEFLWSGICEHRILEFTV